MGHYLGDSPAELLELLQGPGRVQSALRDRPQVACEHGLPSIQKSTGLPRHPLEHTAGCVEARPGLQWFWEKRGDSGSETPCSMEPSKLQPWN